MIAQMTLPLGPLPGTIFAVPDYRVTFAGVYPNLLPCGNPKMRLLRHYATREEAQSVFNEEPSAIRMERYEPETGGWVVLGIKDAPQQRNGDG
jgi:hypothetical protein